MVGGAGVAGVGLIRVVDQRDACVEAEVVATHGAAYDPPHGVSVPPATGLHWRGIQARINGFGEIRAARIESDHNPAHPLANAPDQYDHVNVDSDRCRRSESASGDEQVPPPSRADRGEVSD